MHGQQPPQKNLSQGLQPYTQKHFPLPPVSHSSSSSSSKGQRKAGWDFIHCWVLAVTGFILYIVWIQARYGIYKYSNTIINPNPEENTDNDGERRRTHCFRIVQALIDFIIFFVHFELFRHSCSCHREEFFMCKDSSTATAITPTTSDLIPPSTSTPSLALPSIRSASAPNHTHLSSSPRALGLYKNRIPTAPSLSALHEKENPRSLVFKPQPSSPFNKTCALCLTSESSVFRPCVLFATAGPAALAALSPHLKGASNGFCERCWGWIYNLSICWTCGEVVVRGEERVGYGWCWWHWGCVGCLVCRVCFSNFPFSLV